MHSPRNTPEGNLFACQAAQDFCGIFFTRQDKKEPTLYELYHNDASLLWNGDLHKNKTSIAKFYQNQQNFETTLEVLDAQIMPQMGDILNMITVIAGGKIKQNNNISNFSRTFLIGPIAPGLKDYLILSDTMRVQT